MLKIFLVIIILIFSVFAAEIIARFSFGLGTPPLSVAHPNIEYMFTPNQDIKRFGNRILINEFGMRSISMALLTQQKRVLVFGDSVVNGGNLTDHDELATTRLSDQSVFYGNISAISWGPRNIIAWIEEFGILNADKAIVVISSHDLTDFPNFAALDPNTHPTRLPVSALIEGIQRYLPRYIPLLQPRDAGTEPSRGTWLKDSKRGRDDLNELIDRFESHGLQICVVLHAEKSEIKSGRKPAYFEILSVLEERSVPVEELFDTLAESLLSHASPYRDNIHLNPDIGQSLLAVSIEKCSMRSAVPSSRL